MRGMIARPAAVFRRLIACQRGANAIEMGIVMPVLTLMIVGAIYTGWLLYTTNVLFYAVESAARCGAVNATICPNAAQTQAFAAKLAMGVKATFVATTPACGEQVNAKYTFTFMLPFQSKNLSLPLNITACYPIQT
jgi:Flp pilus assembly protein TadG